MGLNSSMTQVIQSSLLQLDPPNSFINLLAFTRQSALPEARSRMLPEAPRAHAPSRAPAELSLAICERAKPSRTDRWTARLATFHAGTNQCEEAYS